MSEAFQSLQDELSSIKQVEVDQTLAPASKPGPSDSAVNLDLPVPRPQTNSHVEEMQVDYGPALLPRVGADRHNALDQLSSPSEEPKRLRIDLKNTLTLIKGMMLNRGPSRINTMMNPMNLGFHLLNPKNMLTRVNIRLGLNTCHLLQRRISPL